MMDDMEQDSDVSANQLIKLLLSPEDLETKTEVMSPLAFSVMDILGENIDKILMQTVTAKDIGELIISNQKWVRTNMVSYKRQSRREVVQAVTNVRQDESDEFAKSLLSRALGSQN